MKITITKDTKDPRLNRTKTLKKGQVIIASEEFCEPLIQKKQAKLYEPDVQKIVIKDVDEALEYENEKQVKN